MDSDRCDFKAIILLVLLIVVIVGALGISKYQSKALNDNQNIHNRKREETKVKKTEEEKKQEHASIIEKTMDGKLVASGMIKNEGITYRTIHIKKAGYIDDNPGYIYYTMYGKFQCGEGFDPLSENTCIYQPQMGDPDENGYYDYAFGIEVKVDGENEIYGDIVDPLTEMVPSSVMLNEELK